MSATSSQHQIAVIVGSLRKDSINLKLAKALSLLGKDKFNFQILELHDVPMYNEDLWANPPASVTRLKQQIADADGVLIVTPEYNRSFPALTKNVIDWASRPFGHNSWARKSVALIGASPGSIGTAVSQSHLRSVLSILSLHLMPQPEIYFSYKPDVIDASFHISDEKTKSFLEKFLNSFDTWIESHRNLE